MAFIKYLELFFFKIKNNLTTKNQIKKPCYSEKRLAVNLKENMLDAVLCFKYS